MIRTSSSPSTRRPRLPVAPSLIVGIFDDDKPIKIVNHSGDEQPLSLLPIGRIK